MKVNIFTIRRAAESAVLLLVRIFISGKPLTTVVSLSKRGLPSKFNPRSGSALLRKMQ